MAARGWTPEQRQRLGEAVQKWKPWERSTGPRSSLGKAIASRNAFKGGERPALRQMNRLVGESLKRLNRLCEIEEQYEFHNK